MPEERALRRKHCILFVTNHSCQVHSQFWEELHAGPNSAIFPGRSWFPEAPLNGTRKVCTDKYRSASLMAKSLSAARASSCQGFVLHSEQKQAHRTSASHMTPNTSFPCTNPSPPPPKIQGLWAKFSDDTAQFHFCLGNLLIFWLSSSRKDTGLVPSPNGLLDLCI